MRPRAATPPARAISVVSAATAIGLLAVVGLLLLPELALDSSLRHEANIVDGNSQVVR
jgi:hypothetical protein